MAQTKSSINTPLRVRLLRFNRSGLPAIIFLVSIAITLWLWDLRGSTSAALGRVEATRVNVAVGTDGVLVPVSDAADALPKPFDRVAAGQIVARLDSRSLAALLEALRGDVAALQKELESTRAETVVDDSVRQQDHLRQAADLAREVERCKLEVVNANVQIQADRVELGRLEAQLEYLNVGLPQGLVTGSELAQMQSERDALGRLLEAHQKVLAQAQDNWREAAKRQQKQPQFEPAALDDLLAPIRESVAAAEARVREIEAQIESLTIRSPVSGTIAAVYYHPGQGVQAGEPIMTIAADESSHIVAYLSPYQQLDLQEGMSVSVKTRSSGAGVFNAKINRVGSQWEPMPLELLSDQNIAQIVLPVHIQIPRGVALRAGELVEVRFRRSLLDAAN